MTEAQVVAETKRAVKVLGGVRAAAKFWGLSPSYVCDCCNGRRAPAQRILEHLGIECVKTTTYIAKALGEPAADA